MSSSEPPAPIKTPEMERRDQIKRGERCLGRVVSCSGSLATIAAVSENGGTVLSELWSVGRLISITVGSNRIVALVYSMQTMAQDWGEEKDNGFCVEVELMGEVRQDPFGHEVFSAGISQYPYLGAVAHRIRASDLSLIYDTGKSETCVVGRLTQDESIDATIHIPSMLSRHFSVVGSTGVGKSSAVALLLNQAILADPKLRVLILDPHNEFAAAFPEHAVVVDPETLDLPFWLMRLEEFAEVVFRGRPPVPDELDILRDLIPEAKRAFKGGAENGLMRRPIEKSSMTADTPVPYRMADLLALIDDRIGRLEGRQEKPFLRSLKVRVLSAINDPRYTFMFSTNTIQDTILETVASIFRIPGDGRPITTFQLAGIPSEVVNSVVSVLCRMAFEIGLWSNGAVHMLVVCEEAHRYVPADPNLGFLPTRQAIARIAKEGRKYGVSLGIVTQRPYELDQTILSQCSTVFAMRLSNERDQEIIRSAIPNSSRLTTSFIASIGNGEAIAFGEAVAVPMRMRFSRLAENQLPKAAGATIHDDEESPATIDLRTIVSRMRAVSGTDFTALQSFTAPERPMDRPALRVPQPGDGDADAPANRPYDPSMLPRPTIEEPLPESDLLRDRFNQLRQQLLNENPDAPPPLDTRPAARESLFRRPTSLLRK